MLAGAPCADIFTQRPTGPRSRHGSSTPAGAGTGANRCDGSLTPNVACASSTSARPYTGPGYAKSGAAGTAPQYEHQSWPPAQLNANGSQLLVCPAMSGQSATVVQTSVQNS